MEKNATPSTTYVTPGTWTARLGKHHFAYLRSIAEGLDRVESAKRYLGVEHGLQARDAHQQTVTAVRAIARRRGERYWRLIGWTIQARIAAKRPSLEDFIAERDLDGWSEAEVAEMYLEAYPDHSDDPVTAKVARRQKLREHQLALIGSLESLAAEPALPGDLVTGWYEPSVSAKMVAAGVVSLGDLQLRIAQGGRWYSAMPGIGRVKAERISHHLATLLPAMPVKQIVFRLQGSPSSEAQLLPSAEYTAIQSKIIQDGGPLLDVRTDSDAVHAWIAARAGSQITARAYLREANRLLIWLQHERAGKSLRSMQVNDCGDYMAFLQNIPDHWISRSKASPGQPGWAPFRGPLSHASQRQAIVIVASMFHWLQSAQYLRANPWPLVNQKTGDDRKHRMLDSKALSEGACLEVLSFIDRQLPSPSRDRIRFIVRFVEAVGLRASELLQARLADLRLEPEGWVMQVHGKGAKNRLVAVPGQAFTALQEYLVARGLGGVEHAPPEAPLLASTTDFTAPVGYQALYEHVKRWLSKAVGASQLPMQERQRLSGATTHWLRHTFGTRAISREVPLDVIQAQMGHSSIQTTTAIYGRAPIRRRTTELEKAFG